jgi:hypothetical protein
MTNDIADFMRREPGVDRIRHIVKPKLCLLLIRSHMDVRRLIALI